MFKEIVDGRQTPDIGQSNIIKLYTFQFQRRILHFPFLSYVRTCGPRGWVSFNQSSILGTNLVEVHSKMLHTKYQSSTPSRLREKEI